MTDTENQKVKIKARDVTVHYHEARALHGIDLDLNANEVPVRLWQVNFLALYQSHE